MAGDAAQAKTATAESAEAYNRALLAVTRVPNADPSEVVRVALAYGDASALLGRVDDAERAFKRVRHLSHDEPRRLTAMLRIGSLREMQGRYGEAARWYNRTSEQLHEGSEDHETLLVRSKMHFYRAGLFHRKSEHQQCIVEARRALGAAEDANDVENMAHALHRLHLATVYLRRPDRIGYGTKALELFRELGNFERQASVLNNLGIESYFNSNWSAAAEFYQAATDAGLRSGSAIDGMIGALNSGEILSDQGHWDDAIDLLRAALRNWENGRFPAGAAAAKLYMGVAEDRRGNQRVALKLLSEASDAISNLNLEELQPDVRTRLAECEVYASHDVGTVHTSQIDVGSDSQFLGRVTRLRAIQKLGAGRWQEARTELVKAGQSLEGYERALTLRVLAHYDRENADPAWATEAQEIFDSLGVVRLRPLPDPPD